MNGHGLKVVPFQLAKATQIWKKFSGDLKGSPIGCAKILVMFGPQGPEIWDLAISYSKIPLASKNQKNFTKTFAHATRDPHNLP